MFFVLHIQLDGERFGLAFPPPLPLPRGLPLPDGGPVRGEDDGALDDHQPLQRSGRPDLRRPRGRGRTPLGAPW